LKLGLSCPQLDGDGDARKSGSGWIEDGDGNDLERCLVEKTRDGMLDGEILISNRIKRDLDTFKRAGGRPQIRMINFRWPP